MTQPIEKALLQLSQTIKQQKSAVSQMIAGLSNLLRQENERVHQELLLFVREHADGDQRLIEIVEQALSTARPGSNDSMAALSARLAEELRNIDQGRPPVPPGAYPHPQNTSQNPDQAWHMQPDLQDSWRPPNVVAAMAPDVGERPQPVRTTHPHAHGGQH